MRVMSLWRLGKCHRAWVLGLSATVLLVAAAGAERPEPPPYYAIRDARVVTGTGTILERATVVMANGLITAVAPDAEIPADAWVIDGDGLTVYPGLIDAFGDLGQGRGGDDEDEGGGSGGGGPGGGRRGSGGPTIRGPEDRPKTTPWVRAADLLVDDDSRIGDWRAAGFTTALSAPGDGFFSGQAAVINLGESEPRERVVAPSVAQRLRFDGGGGFRTYPGSLMGIIGYIKQVLLDARHYGEVAARYRSSPGGHGRPRYDRALAPVQAALEAGTPFLLPAHLGREIDRVLALSAEYELTPIIYGGHGAYARADALAGRGIPVIIDLEWPEAAKDRDPDADTPFRELAHRRLAPATPARLQAAGVPFAFSAGQLSSPSKAFKGVRAALEAGLDEASALHALTLGAARILGVGDRLGSVATGKIANVVLASGALWDEDVAVEAVFVDGVRYVERPDDEEKEPPASDVSGTWALTMETPRGVREMTAELTMDSDGKVTGELASERGEKTVEKGRMSGDRLSFKTTQTMGSHTVEASFSLIVEGEEASGAMSAGPMSMDLTAIRTAKVAAGEIGDDGATGDDVTLDEIEAALAVYQGPVQSWQAGATIAITNARIYSPVGPIIESGTVLMRDGVITAVGADVEVPTGAEVIDAAGGSLIPGIIDAHSHIAIEGGGNEAALTVTAMVTIQDVIEPDDIAIYRALAGGVTTVNVLHGSANPIGGGNAVIKLRWGLDADGLRFVGAPPGIKFALGENPKRSRGGGPGSTKRYPATRMGVMDVIDHAFVEARAYQREWETYDADTEAGKQPWPPRRDFKLERLAEILRGERLVHAHCYRADEILQLLRLAESHGFEIATLQHVLEGYKVADEIAAHGAGASTFSDWWGYKVEANDAIPHNAALMAERGIVVSINSDSSEEMRHLNQEAAKAMKWGGMGEREALAMITLNPAKQLGIDDRVGSIEVGKDADLVLYDGPPLSMFSVVQKTFVDGDLYFDLEADRERQTRIEAIEARMSPEEDDADEEDADEDDEDSGEPEKKDEVGGGWRVMTAGDVATSCREDHR